MASDEKPTGAERHRAEKSARFTKLLNEPVKRKTPMGGVDSAWALKLKAAIDAAVRELHVEVLSAKPVAVFAPADDKDMLFDLDTSKGRVKAIRTRTGQHVFEWE